MNFDLQVQILNRGLTLNELYKIDLKILWVPGTRGTNSNMAPTLN